MRFLQDGRLESPDAPGIGGDLGDGGAAFGERPAPRVPEAAAHTHDGVHDAKQRFLDDAEALDKRIIEFPTKLIQKHMGSALLAGLAAGIVVSQTPGLNRIIYNLAVEYLGDYIGNDLGMPELKEKLRLSPQQD